MKQTTILMCAMMFAFAASAIAAEPHPSPSPSTQKYTCPMHPDVVKDKPGKCPKCGMTLEPMRESGKSE